MYFYKFTNSNKGIVTTEQPLTGGATKKITKNIGGVHMEVLQQRDQIEGLKFGFTAISPDVAAQMDLKVGDELPLELTDKAVKNREGEEIPNLYWAH